MDIGKHQKRNEELKTHTLQDLKIPYRKFNLPSSFYRVVIDEFSEFPSFKLAKGRTQTRMKFKSNVFIITKVLHLNRKLH
jgi:hypothetical protein